MSDELAKKNPDTAIIDSAQMPGRLGALGSEDFQLPYLHLYQGSAVEEKAFGPGITRGSWIDTNTNEVVQPIIIPIAPRKFVRVEDAPDVDSGQGVHHVCDKVEDIPAEFADPNVYQVVPVLQWLVMVPGAMFPYKVNFKKTGTSAGKTLNTLELTRQQKGVLPGRYSLGAEDAVSKKSGHPYHKPTVRPEGDATAEDIAKAQAFYEQFEDDAAKRKGDDVPF